MRKPTKETRTIEVTVTFPVDMHFSKTDLESLFEDGETVATEVERIAEELEMQVGEDIVDGLGRFDPTWYGDVVAPGYIDVLVIAKPRKVAAARRAARPTNKPQKVARRR